VEADAGKLSGSDSLVAAGRNFPAQNVMRIIGGRVDYVRGALANHGLIQVSWCLSGSKLKQLSVYQYHNI